MREQDLHKKIRENKSNDNIALANALKQIHPELAQSENTEKGAHPKKSILKRVSIFAPLATAAALAIVLIPSLLLNNDGTTNNDHNGGTTSNDHTGGTTGGEPLGDSSGGPGCEYIPMELDCTVLEYNEANGTSFLYFEWDNVSDYEVTKYKHYATEDFLGLCVSLCNMETNDDIEYVICPDDHPLDFLEYNIWICKKESTVSDCLVKWFTVNGNSYGIFQWDSYDYYITLKNSDESRLFELIEILLLSQE
ncbi:MAG: hypothetical protein HDT28_03170 [Clostridiales bacterium]|nr:hypothetical protein [Clostridiales bacterium]